MFCTDTSPALPISLSRFSDIWKIAVEIGGADPAGERLARIYFEDCLEHSAHGEYRCLPRLGFGGKIHAYLTYDSDQVWYFSTYTEDAKLEHVQRALRSARAELEALSEDDKAFSSIDV